MGFALSVVVSESNSFLIIADFSILVKQAGIELNHLPFVKPPLKGEVSRSDRGVVDSGKTDCVRVGKIALLFAFVLFAVVAFV